jgi:hypothetical protein
MARIAVFRSAFLNGAKRRELASCWRQHKRHQNTAARSAAIKSDRILESPFPVQTQISDLNLTDFVWQDVGQWLSKAAVVRTASLRYVLHASNIMGLRSAQSQVFDTPQIQLNFSSGNVKTILQLLGLCSGRPSGPSTSPGRVKKFIFNTACRPTVGPTQPPIQWVPGVKLPGRESDHSPPTSAEVKKPCNYTSTPTHVFMV